MRTVFALLVLSSCTTSSSEPANVAHGNVEIEGVAFVEPQRYRHESPLDDEPEYSTDAEIVFCPNGTVPHYFPGGDIVYDGRYDISTDSVTLAIESFPDASPLSLSADGNTLTDEFGHVFVRVAVEPSRCQ